VGVLDCWGVLGDGPSAEVDDEDPDDPDDDDYQPDEDIRQRKPECRG